MNEYDNIKLSLMSRNGLVDLLLADVHTLQTSATIYLPCSLSFRTITFWQGAQRG